MFKFNSACNFVSNYAFSNKIWHAFALHKNLYYTIKEKFNLTSQFACNVFVKSNLAQAPNSQVSLPVINQQNLSVYV